MQEAVDLVAGWCRDRPVPGLSLEVIDLPGRTPLLFLEVPGQREGTVLLYGHLDKQPEMEGWREGLGPWTPVREGERLFGRGGADDGYAAFAVAHRDPRRCALQGVTARALRRIDRRRVRRAGATTCPSTSTTWPTRIGRAQSGRSASTRAAATTTSSGATTSLRGLVAGVT